MTITIGSRWKRKRSTVLHATVVAQMKHHGVRHIIFELKSTRRDPRFSGDLKIMPDWQFLKLYEHPDKIGDVP